MAGFLLIFASSAGAKLRAAPTGAGHPGEPSTHKLSNHKLQSPTTTSALNAAWPGQSSRESNEGQTARSFNLAHEPTPASEPRYLPISLGADYPDPAQALVSLPANAWGRTVDAYIVRLAGAWEMIKQAGDLDFQLNNRTEMSIKFRDPMSHPRALLVLRTDF